MFKKTAFFVAVSIISTAAFAHSDENNALEHEVSQIEKIREEQNAYFEQLQKDMKAGKPINIQSGKCTYISSIGQPAIANTIALTFDDGPHPIHTPKILDVLKKYGIKATFFMAGGNAKAYPEIVARVIAEGHMVANHSYNHPDFHLLSSADQASQITRTDAILNKDMNGLRLFRYPYGNSTCSSNTLVKELGYKGIVGWHADSCDWAYESALNKGLSAITDKHAKICEVATADKSNYTNHVINFVHNRKHGGIVLLHDVRKVTANNLEQIILRFSEKGYSFTNLDDPRMSHFFN